MGCAARLMVCWRMEERCAQKYAKGDAKIVYRATRVMRLRFSMWVMGNGRMFLVVKSLRHVQATAWRFNQLSSLPFLRCFSYICTISRRHMAMKVMSGYRSYCPSYWNIWCLAASLSHS
jgi:hypothetical protein